MRSTGLWTRYFRSCTSTSRCLYGHFAHERTKGNTSVKSIVPTLGHPQSGSPGSRRPRARLGLVLPHEVFRLRILAGSSRSTVRNHTDRCALQCSGSPSTGMRSCPVAGPTASTTGVAPIPVVSVTTRRFLTCRDTRRILRPVSFTVTTRTTRRWCRPRRLGYRPTVYAARATTPWYPVHSPGSVKCRHYEPARRTDARRWNRPVSDGPFASKACTPARPVRIAKRVCEERELGYSGANAECHPADRPSVRAPGQCRKHP